MATTAATTDEWQWKFGKEGLTFDDVLLIPAESSILPGEVTTATRLTAEIALNIPILSAAMDTVTEARLAIALAREGGFGVIHRNLSIADQAGEVDKVKRSESGMITDPITLSPDDTLQSALDVMSRYHISGIPVTEQGKLVGILTNRDIRFTRDADLSRPIGELMTRERLITASVGATLEEASDILHRYKVEKLPIVDDHGMLKGLITVKDIQKKKQYPLAAKDSQGRLRAGAGVGVGPDALERCEALVAEEVDALVVDTAHGHSRMVIETVKRIADAFGKRAQIIVGNVATAEATEALIDVGAHAIKVGVGPGCFAAGTRILMADGSHKNIEEVQAGDRVINMRGESVRVVKAWQTGVREVMAIRHSASTRETLVTPDHRFLMGDLRAIRRAVKTPPRREVDSPYAPLGYAYRPPLEMPDDLPPEQQDSSWENWKYVSLGDGYRLSFEDHQVEDYHQGIARPRTLSPKTMAHTRDHTVRTPIWIGWQTIDLAEQAVLLAPRWIAGAARKRSVGYRVVKLLERRALGIAVPVYDIEVDCPTHSFIADNVIVHNSICTTRVVAGTGVPQITAVFDCVQAAAPRGIPVIADGGIQFSGDIAKAIAAGADTVMLGSLLAGVDESPGELIISQGERYKDYRGMGSIGAMKGRSYSKDRYFQGGAADESKLIAEGIEGRVPYKGPLSTMVYQLVGGLRQAMGYVGAATIDDLKRARFIRMTGAGLRESHPHDIVITKEAPNYAVGRR